MSPLVFRAIALLLYPLTPSVRTELMEAPDLLSLTCNTLLRHVRRVMENVSGICQSKMEHSIIGNI